MPKKLSKMFSWVMISLLLFYQGNFLVIAQSDEGVIPPPSSETLLTDEGDISIPPVETTSPTDLSSPVLESGYTASPLSEDLVTNTGDITIPDALTRPLLQGDELEEVGKIVVQDAPSYSINFTPTVSGMVVTLNGTAIGNRSAGLFSNQRIGVNRSTGGNNPDDVIAVSTLGTGSDTNNANFNVNRTASHTYTSTGTYVITAKVYHANWGGNEASDIDTETIFIIDTIAPTSTATVSATKIVCDNESDLPNWGAGGPDIISSTASDFLAQHPNNCKIVPWTFEWIENENEPTPKNDDASHLSGWTAFSSSDNSIPAGKKIWIREQFDADYIPFAGIITGQAVSAEIYCDTDVLHYDNLEWINTTTSGTYYCIGFNVLKEKPIENSCIAPIPSGGAERITILSGSEESLQSILDNASYTLNVNTDQQNFQKWNGSNNSVDFQVKLIKGITAATEVFGYYVNNDTGTFVPLFQTTANGVHPNYPGVPVFTAGQITGFTIPNLNSVSFGISVYYNSTVHFYATDNNFNIANEDHSIVYNPATNEYVIAFEDLSFGRPSDKDYNDITVSVKVLSCENAPVCDPKVNLIMNGDFESPIVTNNALWDIFPSGTSTLSWIANWITPSGAPAIANIEIQKNGLYGWTSAEGMQWTELDSDFDGPNGSINGEAAAVKISQDIPTISGSTYNISFEFSPRPGTTAAQNKVEVLADNVPIGTVGPTDGSSLSNTAWTSHSFTFTATDTSTTIALRYAGTPNDSLGTLIDNVNVHCGTGNSNPPPPTPTIKISATKIVCDDELDLPNWGTGGPNITSNTAIDWVAQHESCHLTSGWSFQYADQNAANPGDTVIGEASGRTSFGPTDSFGITTVDIPISNITQLHLREVLQDGYIPFTYGDFPDNSNTISAEFYCSNDVANYDNFDWIYTPVSGETYYCIAFNAPKISLSPTGTIHITKYACPADTELNRTDNGVDGTVPESCSPQQGAKFGYTYDITKTFPDATGPYPGLSPDTTPFIPLTSTDVNGISETTGMALSGRYVIVELDGSGNQLAANQMLAFYCQYDGDPNPNHNDNQEVTYIHEENNNIANCVAYNKADIPPPTYQCSDGLDNDEDGKIDYPADPGCSSLTDDNESDNNESDNNESVTPLYFIDAIKNVSGLLLTLDNGITRANPFTGDFPHQYLSIDRGDGSGQVFLVSDFGITEGSGNTFSGAWTGSHIYATGGTYIITGMVYFSGFGGTYIGSTVTKIDVMGGTDAVPNTPPPSGGGGGGGGGGGTLPQDICPNGDYTSSYYDGQCGTPPAIIPPVIPQTVEETPTPTPPIFIPLPPRPILPLALLETGNPETVEITGEGEGLTGEILPDELLTTGGDDICFPCNNRRQYLMFGILLFLLGWLWRQYQGANRLGYLLGGAGLVDLILFRKNCQCLDRRRYIIGIVLLLLLGLLLRMEKQKIPKKTK